MLQYPHFDPVIFEVGPLAVRWYGMMYVIGVALGWLLGRLRARKPGRGWTGEQMDDFVTYLIVGIVLGGRLGYVLFYNPGYYLSHLSEVFAVWHGGMSFHGGVIGVVAACWIFSRRTGKSLLDVGDFVAPLVPPGLFFGRLGNFINGELWGRTTDGWWGMVFPGAGSVPRHPSQLYEASLEGLALFIVLWWYSSRPRKRGQVGGMFLIGYGVARFIVEFARQPDAQLGFVLMNWMSMGQLLCLPMLALGGWLLLRPAKS